MNIILSSRVKKIIKFIINSNEHITIKDISNEVGVSRRTIMREMDDVYSWFENRNQPVTKIVNKGLILDVPESIKLYLLEELNNEIVDYIYTKEERLTLILTEILQASDYSKLFYFADLLNVSEATISHDLDKVEEWLEPYNLVLERKQGIGVIVQGKERNKRKALITIIYENMSGEQVKTLLSDYVNVYPGVTKQSADIKKRLLDLIDLETINIIEQAINNSELEMGFKFAESSYTALAVHLALAIKRIQKGERITIQAEVLSSFQIYEEYLIASNLVNALKELLEIEIPDDEIAYVTMHLKGAKYKSGLVDTSLLKFNEIVIGNYKLTSMIYQMIKIAEEETGYKLSNLDSLLIGLVDHLRPAISRIQMNLDIRNPLLDTIKEKYPTIYSTSVKCVKVLEENLGVTLPESEIGYIAMHFGSAIEKIKNSSLLENLKYNIIVTCTSGIGTSKMLAERIKNEFKNINIIDVLTSTSITDEYLKEHKVDLIVSTVHFENNRTPVIVVNPLLLPKDIVKLNQKLESIVLVRQSDTVSEENEQGSIKEQLKVLNIYSEAIIEILNNFEFKEDIDVLGFDDFLIEVCNVIHEDKKKSKLLSKELIEREKIGSIVFPEERVIFLHTRSYTVQEIQIGVFRNRQPIIYGKHNFIAAILMVAPKEIEKQKLEVIGEISAKLVNDPSFIYKIKKTRKEVLEELIESYLSEFYKSKNVL